MKLKTDTLIENLKSESEVRGSLLSMKASLLTYYIVVSLLLIWAWSSKESSFNPNFAQIVSAFIGIMAACFAALTAIAASWPGQAKTIYPVLTLFALITWVLTDQILQPKFYLTSVFSEGLECVSHTIQFMVVPVILIMLLVYKAAPISSAYSAFFATCSAGIIANIGMRILCGSESVLHDIVFHITPSAIAVMLLTKGFGTYFSWDHKLKNVITKKLAKFENKERLKLL